jgi:hypothetical protein
MRPTEEILEEAEWTGDIGKAGCLIPSDEVTEGDNGSEE